VVKGKFWFHERNFGDHYFVFIHRGFLNEIFRNFERDPILRFFWKGVEYWDSEFVTGQNFIEILFARLRVSN